MSDRFGEVVDEPGDPFSDMFKEYNQNRTSGNMESIWVMQLEYNTTGGGGDQDSGNGLPPGATAGIIVAAVIVVVVAVVLIVLFLIRRKKKSDSDDDDIEMFDDDSVTDQETAVSTFGADNQEDAARTNPLFSVPDDGEDFSSVFEETN